MVQILVVANAKQKDVNCLHWKSDDGHYFDFQLNSSIPDTHVQWNFQDDASLVSMANWLSISINVSPCHLDPAEIVLSPETAQEYPLLRDIPLANARSRFAILQSINNGIERLLNLTDFRPDDDPMSNASVISKSQSLIFYHVTSDEPVFFKYSKFHLKTNV